MSQQVVLSLVVSGPRDRSSVQTSCGPIDCVRRQLKSGLMEVFNRKMTEIFFLMLLHFAYFN